MRKRLSVILGLLLTASVFPQELIHNPAKPLNPQAGRVLKLEPVFVISDASGEFYFKSTYRFDLDDRGFLFVLDRDQLLKFSPEGKFVANLFKKGQGPGEIASSFQMVSFFCYGDSLCVYDGVGKIIRFDADGKPVEEVKQTAGRFFTMFGKCDQGFYLEGQTNAAWGGPAGFKEIETSAHLISPDGGRAEKIAGFISRIYQGPKFGMDWDNCTKVFNRRDGSLYVSHTCEYKVVRVDLAQRKSVAAFTREYRRVPFVIKEYEKDFYERNKPPLKDFENDVTELFVGGDNVWVQTSTTDKDKGALFDVFDPRGRFLDSFYLPSRMTLRLAGGEFIYVTEKDEDENILVKKYRVLDGPKS
ncbi:MAG: hypothetical protein HGA94_01725, partial [Candidatus Aminicenantes bacterium]|nr:hypothetical protein [Candidatus Aminicenantes bacterium]